MRLIRISAIALIISTIQMFAYAGNFRVNINYLVFHLPDDTSYIEMQFLFLGDGLIYKQNASERYQAIARVKVQFTNEATAQAINRQYNFASDAYEDTALAKGNSLYNLVRISLPQGTYQMQITAFDANDSAATPLTYKNTVKVNFDSEKVCFSDIQALSILTEATEESNFTKYGYDYFPYFSTFYPENITKLFYSVEIYNLEKIGKEKNFYAVGYIAQEGTNSPFSKEFQQEKKLQNSSQNLLIQRFPIDSLPSGNYNLMIDVKDEQGVLYGSTSMFFQRSNPSVVAANTAAIDSLPLDTLKLYLNYIYPAAEKEERAFINNVKSSDYDAIADFFQNFWYKRDPNNPQAAWLKYYKMVMRVNNNYSTLRFKGYKTDRGNCYLRYGPPNYIEYNTSEVNSYAYEIWTYYDFPATSQVNVYFIFYQKDLTTRDFRLMHSNAIGELQDPDWKKMLGTDISLPDDNRTKKETFNTNDYVY